MLVLGLADRMVGYTSISGWKTLDKEMRDGVKQLPELSSKYPSKEVLVGADADFFFAGWNYGMKVGGDYIRVVPLSALFGGIFLLWADIVARTLMPPEDLPIGIVTGFVGGIFFVWLLKRN